MLSRQVVVAFAAAAGDVPQSFDVADRAKSDDADCKDSGDVVPRRSRRRSLHLSSGLL